MSEDSGILSLQVELKTDKDPPVVINLRSPKGKPKIKWLRTGSVQFKFTQLSTATPFSNIETTDTKITCDFNPPLSDPADTEYPYTITVEYNGQDYTSDKELEAEPGQAVIRN